VRAAAEAARPATAGDIAAAKTIGAKTAAAGKAAAAVTAAVVATASMKSAAPAAAARPDGGSAQRQRQHNRANAPHMPPHKNPQKRSIFDAQQCASKYGTSTWMLRKSEEKPTGRLAAPENCASSAFPLPHVLRFGNVLRVGPLQRPTKQGRQ
jgi:hypothetical protein